MMNTQELAFEAKTVKRTIKRLCFSTVVFLAILLSGGCKEEIIYHGGPKLQEELSRGLEEINKWPQKSGECVILVQQHFDSSLSIGILPVANTPKLAEISKRSNRYWLVGKQKLSVVFYPDFELSNSFRSADGGIHVFSHAGYYFHQTRDGKILDAGMSW